MLRASVNAPPRLCEPRRTWTPNARPCRTRRSSHERRLLRELVFLDEELLKLVDDQQDAGQGRRTGHVAIAVDVLHAGVAEPVGPQPQLGVEPLEHADAELALALDRHDARVRQLVRRVDLELDPLLEVDQVEIDLVGAVVQGEVGDQGVHQRRLARAGAAGDQDVLRRAMPEREVLPLGRAGLAERHVDARRGCRASTRRRPAGAMNSNGTSTRLASLAAAPTFWICRVANSAAGGGSSASGYRPKSGSSQASRAAPVPGQVGAVGPELVELKRRRQRFGQVDGDQGQHAARHAAGRDRRQPGRRLLVELGREVGDDQHPVRLGDLVGHGVVFFDRGVLVPQVLLRDRLHVRRQVGQPLLDLAGVGPDLLGDQRRVEVGQVHERAEIAADADRVDDREPHLPRRQAGQQPEHRRLEHRQRRRAALGRRLDQQVGTRRERSAGPGRRTTPARPPSSGRRPRSRRAGRRGRAGPSRSGSPAGRPAAMGDRPRPGRSRPGSSHRPRDRSPSSSAAAACIPSRQRSAIARQAVS